MINIYIKKNSPEALRGVHIVSSEGVKFSVSMGKILL